MPQPVCLKPKRAGERGAALVIAVVLVAIMAVIALAIVNRTTNEIDAVSAKRHYDVAVSCADGARQMLMSQFRTFGTSPTSLTLDQTVGDKRYTSGHYDSFAVTSVVSAGGSQAGSTGVSDIANRTQKSRLGGSVYRMTVVCTDQASATRQSEVEFLVRFGL
jgi:hypothetical protein